MEIRTTRRLPEFFPQGEDGMMTVVYVLVPDRTPLMPCTPVIARLLLKDGKAKVVRRTPFTIKLFHQPHTTYTQSLTLGVDTGSSMLGSAVADEAGHIVYLSEVQIRNDIASPMKARATLRRLRRQRKTRYRPTRWLNRKNSIKTGRFSPTMRSKIEAHLREIRFVQHLLPITSIVLETWGFVTKEHRQLVGLPKAHIFDATVIATRGQRPRFQTTTAIIKRCVPDGDFKQTKGVRSEQRIPTGKIGGFRKFDKVKYLGQEYLIKGRMTTGYAILMTLDGNKVALKPIPKFDKMKRVSARRSWMMMQMPVKADLTVLHPRS
jgi:hypothetical protein